MSLRIVKDQPTENKENKSILSRLRSIHRSRSQIVGKSNSIDIPQPNPKDARVVHSHEDNCTPRATIFFNMSTNRSYQSSENSSDQEGRPTQVKPSRFKRYRKNSGDGPKRRSVSVTASEVDSSSNDILREHWRMERSGKRRVLIAIDEKANSERAFRWYLDYMIEPDDRVLLVHITEPNISIGAGITPTRAIDTQRDSKMYMRNCQSLIDRYLKRARESGYESQVEAHVYLNWRPAEALVATCTTLRADVIVLGSRGTVHSTGLRGLFIGSVLRYVINHSDIPVTVVPPYDVTPCPEDAQCKMLSKNKKKVVKKVSL